MSRIVCVSNRNQSIDVLKGLAIIAVIFYHFGLLKYGYLGVDVFFVLAGYFTTNSIVPLIEIDGFAYFVFIKKRLLRLWPLTIFSCFICMIIGYELMLPAMLKSLAETIIGSVLFLNNIVMYFVSQDYWNVNNNYKPLMHLWYLGVLFQFYLVYPLLLVILNKLSMKFSFRQSSFLLLLAAFSLLLLFIPGFSMNFKFYMILTRFFEFILGGLVFFIFYRSKHIISGKVLMVSFIILSTLIFFNTNLEGSFLRLFIVVLASCLFLLFSLNHSIISKNYLVRLLSFIGISSFSLYISHQIILGFYRCFINDDLNINDYIVLFVFTLVTSWGMYHLFEKSMIRYTYEKKAESLIMSLCSILSIILIICSFFLYKNEGIVRDVPELDIIKSDNSTWIPQLYNERIRDYNIDFEDNGKKNILVAGDSFARDFVNILLESHVDSTMNISYYNEIDDVLSERIKKADYVFVANYGPFDEYYPFLFQIDRSKLYRVGIKEFGSKIGIIYKGMRCGFHNNPHFVNIGEDTKKLNIKEKKLFGKHYLDILSLLQRKDGSVPVFTSDKKFYSHDGIHLTRAGACDLAKRLQIIDYLR